MPYLQLLAAFMNYINSMFLDRLGRVRIMLIGLVSCSPFSVCLRRSLIVDRLAVRVL